MIILQIIVYFFLFFLPIKVLGLNLQHFNSINLTEELNNFLKKEHHFNKNYSKIKVLTPIQKKIYCKKPIFSLLNNVHTLGIINVLLNCNEKNYYLTVEVCIEGEYIVANRKIPRGTKIQESDLKTLIGRLDILPNNICRKKKDIINKINLRDFFPFQPITSSMIRPIWLIKFNQEVTVIINGDNFIISSKAKALSNGSENEKIRVKTKTGKIINGIINKNAEVIVSV